MATDELGFRIAECPKCGHAECRACKSTVSAGGGKALKHADGCEMRDIVETFCLSCIDQADAD
jgi:hypothetical protein